MAQQAKIYLDDDGNPIKPEPKVTGTLDTAPSLKTKTYLDPESGEPLVDESLPEVVSNRGAIPEADSYGAGFMRSILGGDALSAGMEGAKGFVKGATIDIPESIIGAVKGAYGAVTDPIGTLKSIPPAMREMYDLTMQAGARPEEFGRMMGNVTGQPLTTAGLAKGIPSATRMAGAPVELAGRTMRKYAPVSNIAPIIMGGTAGGMMGGIPGMVGGGIAGRLGRSRIARNIERGIGSGIENVGQRMRSTGLGSKTSPDIVNNSIADDIITNEKLANERPSIAEQITEPDFELPKKQWKDPIIQQLEDILPKSDVLPDIDVFKNKPLNKLSDQELVHLTRLSPALGGSGDLATNAYTELIKRNKIEGYPSARKYETHNLNTGEIKEFDRATNTYRTLVDEAPFASESDSAWNKMDIQKADFRPDGTIVDIETGNIFDGNGQLIKQLPPKSIVNEPITKDSKFFKKNR